MSYPSFPSIERLENLYCHITEKVDGTNGLIEIGIQTDLLLTVNFGSQNRYISSHDDNMGFVNFFEQHTGDIFNIYDMIKEEKGDITLPLHIYGEWFGKGIQRGYGLADKHFMPFSEFLATKLIDAGVPNIKMPVTLHSGKFSIATLDGCMNKLKDEGSQVIPGYNRPEGVVIYFPTYNFRLKETFEGPKWKDAIPKPEHDKKPTTEDIPICETCGRKKYLNKKDKTTWQCMNYHCPSSPNHPKE